MDNLMTVVWNPTKTIRTEVYEDIPSQYVLVVSKNFKGHTMSTKYARTILESPYAPGDDDYVEFAIKLHKSTGAYKELIKQTPDSENPCADVYINNYYVPMDYNPIEYTPVGGLYEIFNSLLERVKHPVTQREIRLSAAIINLNDHHGWTRQQIADWLESLDVDLSIKEKTQ